MLKKIVFLISCLFFIVNGLFAQSLRKAERAAANDQYEKSVAQYKKVIQKDSNNFKANFELGALLYQYMNNPGEAGKYLLRAEKLSKPDTSSEIIYGLAQYFHAIGKYQQAIAYYNQTLGFITEDEDGGKLKKSINRSIEACHYAENHPITEKGKKYKINNIGDSINTIYPEYVPIVTNHDSTLLFTSRRKTNSKTGIDNNDDGYFEDMFIATKKDGKFRGVSPFPGNGKSFQNLSNTNKDHESVISLSYDGKKLFTFKENKIYESEMANGIWSTPKELSIIDSNTYQNHITLSKDGNTMYFSAEVDGTKSKLDLFSSKKQANGTWAKPEKLSEIINTEEDESSPQISEDGKTLYFASRGHGGYGGYDFYKTINENGIWSQPINMGLPFNSPGDDIYITLNSSETRGYMSSSRAGGMGDMDIYEIIYKRKAFEDYKVDAENRIAFTAPDTAYVGENVKFTLKQTSIPLTNFNQINWLIGDSTAIDSSNSSSIEKTFTKTGIYNIKVEVQNNASNDFYGYEKNIVIVEKPSRLATNTFGLEPLYFDFNKSSLNEDAIKALERNIQTLNAHPDATIEIAAFCDSRGTTAYNQALSEKRAKAVSKELKKRGFNVKRVKEVDWFGEKDPVNNCADGVTCSEDEYKLNRRAEFRLIK